MNNVVDVRATFAGLNIKGGKAVMQFELDGEYRGELPRLATMTGKPVLMELSGDQQVLFVDGDTGEEVDGQAEAFPEENEVEEPDEAEPEELDAYPEPEPEYEPPELPAPSYDYGDEAA